MSTENGMRAVRQGAWVGQAQGDDHEHLNLLAYLQTKGWVADGEDVLAWKVLAGEHTKNNPVAELSVIVYYAPAARIADARRKGAAIRVENLHFSMPALEFFALFARLSMTMSGSQDMSIIVDSEPVYK